MKHQEKTLVIGAVGIVAVLFLLPMLPSALFRFTDLFVVRLALLGAFLYIAQKDPLYGLAFFLVLASLFIQRNKQKLLDVQTVMSQSTPMAPAIQSIETPPTAPPQPEFEAVTSDESIPFMPAEDTGENTFAPAGPSINQKYALPTETVDGSDKAIQQLFTWVNPSLTQRDY